ncbi:MAG: Cys-tRNA(Pro)/Cys-tRNA(Cys) deacylase [Saprospiraceae bacterium]|nr:MAG: Cys-tRNA(Pro)/Cys-tRNA(Cys) deacylase [Saprospiraceae bacterium]
MKKTNAIRILDQLGIGYQTVAYTYDPDNLDVAHLAQENGLSLPQIFKTLVCKGDKTGPVVAVIAGDRQLDLKQLAKVSGNRKMAMVAVKELQPLTGYVRGGCSPIGMKKAYPVYLDAHANQHDLIYINAGQRGLLVGLHPDDLVRACGAVVVAV